MGHIRALTARDQLSSFPKNQIKGRETKMVDLSKSKEALKRMVKAYEDAYKEIHKFKEEELKK